MFDMHSWQSLTSEYLVIVEKRSLQLRDNYVVEIIVDMMLDAIFDMVVNMVDVVVDIFNM